MEFYDEIINVAMLGAGKKMPDAALLPEDLKLLALQIQEQPIDREEKFLQIASLAFNFRQCGVATLQIKDVVIARAPDEEKRYCSNAAMQALNDALECESLSLLYIWLALCNKNSLIVTPGNVPAMLNLATQNKKLRANILTACGKRGQWLCQFNKEWNFATAETPEEIWQTGTLEQRKQVLSDLRNNNPGEALEWLRTTWNQEGADNKFSFLEILATNLSESDISFLESLSAEKSKKVKDQAIELLKQIPNSSIVELYQQVLRDSVTISKQKSLLGLSSKKVLQFQLPPVINEEVFKTGIQKLSPAKHITDEHFILYQIISFVPPPFWEKYLLEPPHEIVELFNKSELGKELLPALGLAAGRFKNIIWATQIIQDDTRIYIDLVLLMPPTIQEKYLLKYFDADPASAINCALRSPHEWGIELTKNIFAHAAKNPYQYNRAFFSQYIHLVPVDIVDEMETFVPAEEYMRNAWENIALHISKLLKIKTNIIQSFNP